MKISVSWLFDHLDADWKKQDIAQLHTVFNQKTAEMETVTKIAFDLTPFTAAIVTQITKDIITLEAPEWNKTIQLPFRSDAKINQTFLIKKNPNTMWATPADFNSEKEGLLPNFYITKTDLAGAWKKTIETEDVILEIDNKSLTHRPDLWGHYGFAREISAILNIPFKPLPQNLPNQTTQIKNPYTVEIQAPTACKRFIATYFESFKEHGSNLHMGLRLLKVGMRPINGIVDLTNYVMLETSQPSHAFDAERIANKKLIVRKAHAGDTITLLDESKLELDPEDLVIADSEKILGLAGVRGGLHDSITQQTKAVFLEVAHFDATTIRRSAARHKTRTDASARFEKTLDPNQLEMTTARIIALAQIYGIEMMQVGPSLITQEPNTETVITVAHEFLIARSGIKLTQNDVIAPLTKLGFTVTYQEKEATYRIAIPTYRGTKDVQTAEDILEEVVRMYGFTAITPTIPAVAKPAENIVPLMRLRKLKNYLSVGCSMLEQCNYAFFDEAFMTKLEWNFPELIELKHPVSEQYKRLVPTLIPNLLKNVYENAVEHDSLAFFESARTWNPIAEKETGEKKRIAGIIFEKRKTINFYEGKALITKMLQLCDIFNVTFKKTDPQITTTNPWMRPFQTAALFVNNTPIGYAGKANPQLLLQLDCLPESDAFIFELDAEFLYNYKAPITQLKPLLKYQDSTFDLSMMVPLTLETSSILNILKTVDPIVQKVTLIDFFEKKEWNNERSLAFRMWICHPDKTLVKEEIDAIMQKSIVAVEKQGAKVRV